MTPRKPNSLHQTEMFRVCLIYACRPDHPLMKLSEQIPWEIFEEHFGKLYCPDNGRPGLPIRMMVGLLLLKHARGKNKVYSAHAPEVECISKGKVHKRYEFSVKVGIAGPIEATLWRARWRFQAIRMLAIRCRPSWVRLSGLPKSGRKKCSWTVVTAVTG